MSNLETALAKFPPSTPSRCSKKLPCIDYACPKCPFNMSSCSDRSTIQFQLTYTSDRATYAPCYFPVIPRCQPLEPPRKEKRMFCAIKCKRKERSSTLPPPCYHCKPPPFHCPREGCLPPEPRIPVQYYCPPSCPPLICRPRPEPLPRPPTICIAGPCPRPTPKPCYPPSAPKISPPLSCVRFCIRSTNEGLTYCPCYSSALPKCPGNIN